MSSKGVITTWKVACQVCGLDVPQAVPSELVIIAFEDGTSQGYDACSKCARLVREQMEEIAEEEVELAKANPKVFKTREDIENRGNRLIDEKRKAHKAKSKTVKKETPTEKALDTPDAMQVLLAINEQIQSLTKRVASLEDVPAKKGRAKRTKS